MLITEPTVKEKIGEKLAIAITVAIATLVALAIIFIVIEVIPAIREEPELVAKIVSDQKADEKKMEQRTMMKQIRQASTTTAAKPIANLIRSNSVAKLVAPKVSRNDPGPIGLGEGEFGAGFGGSSQSMGSGASFFGTRSTGRRFLFVLDHSASNSTEQIQLRDRELKRALNALPRGVQYQVILFGGGALFAEPGWKAQDIASRFEVTDPRRNKYTFTQYRGINDWQFEGPDSKMPKANWLTVSPSNISRSLSVLDDIELFYGTDWEIALRIGHLMRPPPDVIYFMSDGTGGNAPRPIIATNRKYGRPKINTFAMQTTDGASEFFEIANETGGEFIIVNREGKPIKVSDPRNISLE